MRMTGLVDPATVTILQHALHRIAEEMGVNLLHAARSTVIREARDCSCALLDAQGRIIAEAEHIPVQMSSLSLPLTACLRKFGTITPGEVFVINDPFQGGQHLQDIIIFTPVFVDGELLGFAGSIAHHVDIGGASAGLTFDATETFQEGLRLPGLRLNADRDFAPGGIFYDFVAANVRAPQTTIGDLRAQLAANHVGATRLQELARQYGLSTLRLGIEATLDYAERLIRQGIAGIPDGVYRAEDVIDSGVFTRHPIPIRVTLTVQGSDLLVDFTGTHPQVPEFINVPLGSTYSTTYSVIKMALSSGGRRIPANAGCYRPIQILVPEGSLLNPTPPFAVRARMCGAYRIFDAVLLALAQAMPDRVPALGFHVNTTSGFSRFADGRYWIFIEDLGGGWGGTPVGDGADGLDAPLSNCRVTPVEALELDHPYLRVERYALLPNSGGAGKFRGGLGAVREYRVLADGVEFFGYADRHRFPPRGLAGGGDGTCGAFRLIRRGRGRRLPSKIKCPVQPGDLVQVRLGGGGGYGPPLERDPARAQEDVRLGKVTRPRLRRRGEPDP
ncbi:MAG: hydantoinase B/oxoprolinase family protein [Armatimonadota bacterium]|nr:hydantoinase B/oxoprolinase family protein [Armatimonadota bacterium]MDR7489121.1 hydantoinase B/oxoprolinase family protein [Armatimonadota bacterium]MDR7527394.1 hydantoinase B/oxoprolinase family protein [Armatimonadota bacterium]MDR7574430.1 hydantoinase B/oxoprolinase family protein [Armatimonadota bacterium]MDR7585136.1 hydantoinase B/oxoprolinase family protein [Armatimonadota bacterium]